MTLSPHDHLEQARSLHHSAQTFGHYGLKPGAVALEAEAAARAMSALLAHDGQAADMNLILPASGRGSRRPSSPPWPGSTWSVT